MIDGKTFYEVLGVSEGASFDEIRAAYRSLIQKYHPDRFQPRHEAEQRTRQLTQAYRVLGRQSSRDLYDRELATHRASRAGTGPGAAAGPHATGAGAPPPPQQEQPTATATQPPRGDSGWRWWLTLFACFLAVKLLGVLMGIVCIVLIGFTWKWLRARGAIVAVLGGAGVFGVCAVLAITLSLGVTSTLTAPRPTTTSAQAAAAPTAEVSAQPQANPFDQFDTPQPSVDLVGARRANLFARFDTPEPSVDLMGANVSSLTQEQWDQLYDAYWRQEVASRGEAYDRVFQRLVVQLNAQHPDMAAGELLNQSRRQADLELQSQPKATAAALPAANVPRAPEYPVPNNEFMIESLPAEEQMRIYDAESKKRLEAFDAERKAKESRWQAREMDPAKVIPSAQHDAAPVDAVN